MLAMQIRPLRRPRDWRCRMSTILFRISVWNHALLLCLLILPTSLGRKRYHKLPQLFFFSSFLLLFLASFSFLIPAAAFWFLVPRNNSPIFSGPRLLLIIETRHCLAPQSCVTQPRGRALPTCHRPRRRRPSVSPPSAVSHLADAERLARSGIPHAGFKTIEAPTSPTDVRMRDVLALSPATAVEDPRD